MYYNITLLTLSNLIESVSKERNEKMDRTLLTCFAVHVYEYRECCVLACIVCHMECVPDIISELDYISYNQFMFTPCCSMRPYFNIITLELQ